MLNFYQKRTWRAIVQTPFFLLFLLVICGILATVVYERYSIEREMAGRRAEVEDSLKALEARKEALREKVEYLSNERGIEAEMRRNFDVARTGEQVVIILDPETDQNKIMPLSGTSTPKRAWYQFWR